MSSPSDNEPESGSRPDNNPEPQDIQAAQRREHGEPMDRLVPVSMVIMVFIAVLFFWAGVYITLYNGNFDPFTYDERRTGAGVKEEPPAPPEPLPVLGAKIYKRNCVQCHQEDGKGVDGSYPPLVGAPWVTGSPERMAKLILSGMQGDIEVLGKKVLAGNMPAWRENLNDRQIAAVMTYLRTKKEWNHNSSEVTPEQISEIRKAVGSRGPWTPEELLKLYP